MRTENRDEPTTMPRARTRRPPRWSLEPPTAPPRPDAHPQNTTAPTDDVQNPRASRTGRRCFDPAVPGRPAGEPVLEVSPARDPSAADRGPPATSWWGARPLQRPRRRHPRRHQPVHQRPQLVPRPHPPVAPPGPLVSRRSSRGSRTPLAPPPDRTTPGTATLRNKTRAHPSGTIRCSNRTRPDHTLRCPPKRRITAPRCTRSRMCRDHTGSLLHHSHRSRRRTHRHRTHTHLQCRSY